MIKYTSSKRLGHSEVEGILNGEVVILPKLDGANGQIYLNDEGVMECASRETVLNEKETNRGFWNHVFKSYMTDNYIEYFKKFPHHILYGEWMVKHTFRDYKGDIWEEFYVFDVLNVSTNNYIPYSEYIGEIINYKLCWIPCLAKMINPSEDDVKVYLLRNKFKTVNDAVGEGIVIKNYKFVNEWGRYMIAKVVLETYKEIVVYKKDYSRSSVETKIANRYVTEGRLDKIKQKMMDEKEWENKRITEYLGRVYFEIINDEIWSILKKYKSPVINFRKLNNAIVLKIKEIDTEVF